MAWRRPPAGSLGTRDARSRPPANGSARSRPAPKSTSAATERPRTCVPRERRSQAAPVSPARRSVAVSSSFTSAKTAADRAQLAPSAARIEAHDAISPLRNGSTCRRKVVAPESDHAVVKRIRSTGGSNRLKRKARTPKARNAGCALRRKEKISAGERLIARTTTASSASARAAPKIFFERGREEACAGCRAGTSGGIRSFPLQRNLRLFSLSSFSSLFSSSGVPRSLLQHELLEERPIDGDEVREETGEDADDGGHEEHRREQERLDVTGRVVIRDHEEDVSPDEPEAGGGEERCAAEEDGQRLVERRDTQDVRALYEHVVRGTPDQARGAHGRVRAHGDRRDGHLLVAGLDERLEPVGHPREHVEPEGGLARQ